MPSLIAAQAFSPYVAEDGSISLPADFHGWVHLGTWSIASDEEGGGAAGFHVVYTQRNTIDTYRESGHWPDGAVIVKELFATKTEDLTTGHVSYAADAQGWFVLIKDRIGRFPGHPLWGDGWGWALFEAADPSKTVTENYKEDCVGCHQPPAENDWVYLQGYPALK